MIKENINVYRVISILIMIAATTVLSCVYGFYYGSYIDEVICIAIIDLIFMGLFIFELEFERVHKCISGNIATTYIKVAVGYVICMVLAMLLPFIPGYIFPIMVIPIILSAVGNEVLGLTTGLYVVALYAMISGCEGRELACNVTLLLFGYVILRADRLRSLKKYIAIVIICVNVIIPNLFSYIGTGQISILYYIVGLCNGLVCMALFVFVYPVIRKDSVKEIESRLWYVISDDYYEVKNLMNKSMDDYVHAKKVSAICQKCARYLGLSESLCAAAGFYYRMGKWLGEPHVENGVEKAATLDFPQELIVILAEYNGEKKKPSTVESALVQMIDALTLRIAAITHEGVGKSTWNHEMIIYQTLNDFSGSGLYDESGLTMNQYLKMREFLVKEDTLK